MIGFFDRDVFLKLCCCDLIGAAIEVFGITSPYRLPSTSSDGSNHKVLARKLDGDELGFALERVRAAVLLIPILNDELLNGLEASDEFQRLCNCEDIDGGEHQLAAILLRNAGRDEQVLVSGDKRFVRAFRTELAQDWDTFKNSVISFESCILAIFYHFGFEYIHVRAYASRNCDESLRLAFGIDPEPETFRLALVSFDPCRVE